MDDSRNVDSLKKEESTYGVCVGPPHIIAYVTYLTEKEGGRKEPVDNGYRGQFRYVIHGRDCNDWSPTQSFPRFPNGYVNRGERVLTYFYFDPEQWDTYHKDYLTDGRSFEICEGDKVVATGKIIDVANDCHFPLEKFMLECKSTTFEMRFEATVTYTDHTYPHVTKIVSLYNLATFLKKLEVFKDLYKVTYEVTLSVTDKSKSNSHEVKYRFNSFDRIEEELTFTKIPNIF